MTSLGSLQPLPPLKNLKQLTENFDYETILKNWDATKEQQKADFMEHLYQCYRPANCCYTGLWERFLHEEAGPFGRDIYFQRLQAVREFEIAKLEYVKSKAEEALAEEALT